MNPELETLNARLVRGMRVLMTCYALKWKFFRRDPVERAEADRCKAEAIRLREQARYWEDCPL